MKFQLTRGNPVHDAAVRETIKKFHEVDASLPERHTNGMIVQAVVDKFWPDATEEETLKLVVVIGVFSQRAEQRAAMGILADAFNSFQADMTTKKETPNDVSG